MRAHRPVVLTGFGLGAFADGIVLHQVLQWHHVAGSYLPDDNLAGLEQNTFWDGLFHASAWVVVLAGLLWTIAWRRELAPLGPRRFVGWLLIGWGGFHVVDQLLFHLLLEAHHIRMVESYQVYDWGYTAIGVALALLGWRLTRRPERDPVLDQPVGPGRSRPGGAPD